MGLPRAASRVQTADLRVQSQGEPRLLAELNEQLHLLHGTVMFYSSDTALLDRCTRSRNKQITGTTLLCSPMLRC
jgi:hypothetical protein